MRIAPLLRSTVILMMLVAAAASCTQVKEYQKSRLTDTDMELAARKAQRFEQNAQLYREGASGANGGKSGGGCGCN